MKVAVTGGSGAIGTFVCDELAKSGHDVTAVDIVPPKIDVPFIELDLGVLDDTCKALAGFDQVLTSQRFPIPSKIHPSASCPSTWSRP